MGFKQSPFPMIEGTAGHKSASPNKGLFSKKEKAEPDPALTRDASSAKLTSPAKMPILALAGPAIASMMGGAAAGGAAAGGAAAGGAAAGGAATGGAGAGLMGKLGGLIGSKGGGGGGGGGGSKEPDKVGMKLDVQKHT